MAGKKVEARRVDGIINSPEFERKRKIFKERLNIAGPDSSTHSVGTHVMQLDQFLSITIDDVRTEYTKVLARIRNTADITGYIVNISSIAIRDGIVFIEVDCVEGDIIYERRIKTVEDKSIKTNADAGKYKLPKKLTDTQQSRLAWTSVTKYRADRADLTALKRIAKKFNVPLPEEVLEA